MYLSKWAFWTLFICCIICKVSESGIHGIVNVISFIENGLLDLSVNLVLRLMPYYMYLHRESFENNISNIHAVIAYSKLGSVSIDWPFSDVWLFVLLCHFCQSPTKQMLRKAFQTITSTAWMPARHLQRGEMEETRITSLLPPCSSSPSCLLGVLCLRWEQEMWNGERLCSYWLLIQW